MKRPIVLATLLMFTLFGALPESMGAQAAEWRRIGPRIESRDVRTFAAATWPADRMLFAGSSRWLARSEDDGATWVRLQHAFRDLKLVIPAPGADRSGLALAIDASPGYGSPSHLLRSTDRGETWNVAAEIMAPSYLVSSDDFAFAPDFASSGIAFYQGERQLLRTADFGASWDWIDVSLATEAPEDVARVGQQVRQIALSPAFAQDRTVFASVSVGQSFPSPEDPDADRRRQAEGLLRPLTTNHQTSLGIIVSRDAGVSWSSASSGMELVGQPARVVASLAVSPTFDEDRTLFVWAWGAPERVQVEQESRLKFANGVFRSQDGGASWSLIWDQPTPTTDGAGVLGPGVLQMELSPAYARDTTLVAAVSRPQQVSSSARIDDSRKVEVYPRCDVYRSEDGGLTWTPTLASPVQPYYQRCGHLRASPRTVGWSLVLAGPGSGGNRTWRKSADGGRTWEPLPSPPRPPRGDDPTLQRVGPQGEILVASGDGAWTLGGPAPTQPGAPACPLPFAADLTPTRNLFTSLDSDGCAAEPARTVSVLERRIYGSRALWIEDDSPDWLLLGGVSWGTARSESSQSGIWSWRSKRDEPWTGPPDRIMTGIMQRTWGSLLLHLTSEDNSREVLRIEFPTPAQPDEPRWEIPSRVDS